MATVPSQLLRTARARAGLSQRDLATLAGTSQSVVARVELGETSPTWDTLMRLLNAADFELQLDLVARSVHGSPILGAEARILASCPRLDETWMRRSLELAQRALAAGEVPVGAVVVLDATVVGEGSERTCSSLDPTSHAEVEALREACRSRGSLDLSSATLYTTVEPCLLCAYAIRYTRISRVVYGSPAGSAGGVTGVFPLLGDPALMAGSPTPEVRGGVLQPECTALLDAWRAQKRDAD